MICTHNDSTDIIPRNLRRIISHPEFERYTKVNDICLLQLQVSDMYMYM